MASSGQTRTVREAAELLAGEWLVEHAYCDCAIQRQTITLRLLPVVAMFEEEIQRNTRYARQEMGRRMAIYLMRAHDDLTRGLHRPGASGKPSSWRGHGAFDGKAN